MFTSVSVMSKRVKCHGDLGDFSQASKKMTAICCQRFQLPLCVVCHMNGSGYERTGGGKPLIHWVGIETICPAKYDSYSQEEDAVVSRKEDLLRALKQQVHS